MICKNCGHQIVKYGEEYLHVKPSSELDCYYLTRWCDQEIGDYEYCRCNNPEPEGDVK